ncbi:MAG: protoporphyrinogen oxidase [Magnetococcales bacterium]|nr:protoporphyrinogen oxidase [Magnetococcales bacterium]
MSELIIAGGGISGLATAWFLHRRGIEVTLLEGQEEVGGLIRSSLFQDYLLEHGPNSTLQKPGDATDALGRLVDDLGLAARLLVADSRAARRYVYRQRRLQPLPASPPQFLRSGLFSWRAKWRLLREPFIARGDGHESIGAFVTRRLGAEFLDYAVEPFVSGVYAGDPWRLSVAAALPRIHALEREHGSLIRGAMALGRLRKTTGLPAGRLVTFDAGMELLPRTIAEKLPADALRTGTRVTALEPMKAGGWRVTWQRGDTTGHDGAPRVILSLPAPEAAQLVAPFSPAAAEILRSIAYAPIVSLGMGWLRDRIGHPLDGFGFLVPRREGMRTLGALFSSTLFPRRAPPGRALLTAFIGGATDPGAATEADHLLSDQVGQDLSRSLDIQGAPEFVHMTRHSRAIPQYAMDHLEKLQSLEIAMAPFPGLHFRANWRDGISVADCIRNAEALATQIVA